jgi:hypothetical protein
VDINLQDATRLGVNEEKQLVAVETPLATHQPFTWLHDSLKGNEHGELASLTKTICSGMSTCLQLVIQARLEQDNGDTPLMSINDAESLLMFAAAASELLADAADESIVTLNRRAMKEVAA